MTRLSRLRDFNISGLPSSLLTWSQRVCEQIEAEIGALDEATTANTNALAALQAAQDAQTAADAAALTANWSGVTDDDGNKPENNATLGADLATNVANNTLDNVSDSTTRKAFLSTERSKLSGVEAGATLGANLATNVTNVVPTSFPPIASANLRYLFTGTSSYSASAGTPATATISVSAGSLKLGSTSVSYNAMSANVSGTGGTSVTYYLYVSTGAYSGGAHTLHTTTTGTDIYSNDNYVYIDTITVTYPSSGTSTGSGDGSGGGFCVTPDTPILMADLTEKPAGELQVGDMLRTRHEHTLQWGEYPVEAVTIVEDEPLFRAEIDGKNLRATAMHRIWLGAWAHVCSLGKPDGRGAVVRITVSDAHTYVSNGILSHNTKPRT